MVNSRKMETKPKSENFKGKVVDTIKFREKANKEREYIYIRGFFFLSYE